MIVSTLSLCRVYVASLKLFVVLQRVRRYTDVHDCDVACNGSAICSTHVSSLYICNVCYRKCMLYTLPESLVAVVDGTIVSPV